MGAETSVRFPVGRLVGVGLIVFFANAALLVLQLVAGRLLAPFVGSSLETWTSVIGVFLTGIALGNALGGKLADRYPSPRTLALLLAVGALTALWMVAFPVLVAGAYKSIPLGPRIPILAFGLCLPAGFVLSLLTPLAIKLGLPDVSKTGRVAGMVFSLSTLGCLVGNYLTGFVLMKSFTINELVFLSAGALAVLAAWAFFLPRPEAPAEPSEFGATHRPAADDSDAPATNPHAFADIRVAYLVVFLASFGGMALELTGSRVLAQHLGVSLFTWTGIIGVMLAGTALGNLMGGVVADRMNKPGLAVNPRAMLAGTLIVGGAGTVLILLVNVFFSNQMFGTGGRLSEADPVVQVMVTTFSMFFLPMFALGMVSPQVIRLAVPDVAHVGRVAGRVYAWSTAGAIAGTFATGFQLLSTLGMNNTLMAVALVLVLTSLLVAKVWEESGLLYLFSIVLGGVTGGFILNYRAGSDPELVAQLESNYYTIKVTRELAEGRDENGNVVRFPTGFLYLNLDRLLHSSVHPDHPEKLHYTHEYVQMEFLRGAKTAANPNPRVLVIGGGGYTFPRAAMELLPETRMDVVEIDPGVTKVAREHLGLKDYQGMTIVHMDGRQFVSEKVPPGTYDLVIQDAVNDFSVPSHLMTKEYNDAVKAALKPGGVYLLTVIDNVEYGQLWKAAMHTLRESYPPENVCLLLPDDIDLSGRQVYVIYASDTRLDLTALQDRLRGQFAQTEHSVAAATAVGGGGLVAGHAVVATVASADAGRAAIRYRTRQVPPDLLRPYLERGRKIVLTDQFAPVDNLMADVFRELYTRK
ncbi:MAG TPA: fused MFS/spermidine synthase [Gemmata sp.]|nr:fused MFS/spermidine synthase [Gemmata sp.]